MFTSRAGRPNTVGGGGDKATIDDWEGRSGSESNSYKEEDEEEDPQEFIEEEAGQEIPSAGSGQLDQILERISALASAVALLQVQADQKRRLPQQGAQKSATLRRAPTGTPITRGAFPPTSTPAIPTAPTQTFQPTPALTPVHRICDTMAGVAETTPDPSVPGFPGIFALLEDGVGPTPPSDRGWRFSRPCL